MEKIFSDNLRRLRTEKGLTQEQAAERLGVSPQAVSRWENAVTLPDVLLLPAVAALYGVSVDELYRRHPVAYENPAQRLAAVYEQSGRPEDFMCAVREFEKLFRTAETPADRWLYAMVHQQMMFYCREKAMESLTLLTDGEAADDEWYWKARRQLLYLRFQSGTGESALREQLARAQERTDVQEWLTLAAAYSYQGDWSSTLDRCEKITEHFPDAACPGLVYSLAGDACKALGAWKKAETYWEKAIAKGCWDARFSQAFACQERGDWAQARLLWTAAAEALEMQGLPEEADFPRRLAQEAKRYLDGDGIDAALTEYKL